MTQINVEMRVPDLPVRVWETVLDDMHERAVSLYEAGDRAVADELAEWIAVLDEHTGSLNESCVHAVCQPKGRCLFAREGESA